MEKFNLEKALKGAPLITRDGQAAKIVAHQTKAPGHYPLVVEVNQVLHDHAVNGRYLPPFEDPLDLFMEEVADRIKDPEPKPNPAQKEFNF